MEKRIKAARIVVLILAVLNLAALDVSQVQRIQGDQEEGYWRQHGIEDKREIQNETWRTPFEAVSEALTCLQLWGPQVQAPEGTLLWWIEDEAGNLICETQQESLKDIWHDQNRCTELDVSTIVFSPSKTYVLVVQFQLERPIKLSVDDKGLMLTQRYRRTDQGMRYAILLILNLLIAAGLAAVWRWGLNHQVFLGLAAGTGIVAALLLTPFSRDDEFRHFVRAYDLSCGGHEGYYAVPGADAVGNIAADEQGRAQLIRVPKEISEMRTIACEGNYDMISYFAETNRNVCVPRLRSLFRQPEAEGTQEVSELAVVGKGWESYWPQAILIALGRLLGIRSGLWCYLASIGQAFACSLLLWAAFRLTKQKALFALCGLVPMITFFRGSCNPDGLMMAEIVLALALILRLREQGISLLEKQGLLLLALYLVLVLQVGLMKMPYALLCLGFFLLLKKENFSFLPWSLLKEHRCKLIAAGAVLCGAALVYSIGIRKGDFILRAVYLFVPREHVEYFFSYFGTCVHMFLGRGKGLLIETYHAMHGSCYVSYALFAAVVLLLCKRTCGVWCKCYQVFLFFCMLGMVVLVGYTFMPPDFGSIWGVTYRYILPSLPILALALPMGTQKTEEAVEQIYPLPLVVLASASCLTWIW